MYAVINAVNVPRLLLQLIRLILAATCTLVAACSLAQPEPAAERVFFASPADGAVVSSPVRIEMGAENFAVEPAGEVRPGAGHLHIIIDGECVPAGQVVPNDETHRHFGKAQLEAELELAPGTHTLCLQAANGAHTALPGLQQVITVTVE